MSSVSGWSGSPLPRVCDETSAMTHPPDPEPLPEAPPIEVQKAQEERLLEAWKTPEGWRYWSAVNNSVVGQWYTAVTVFFLLFGGVLALLMRLQLAFPDNTF